MGRYFCHKQSSLHGDKQRRILGTQVGRIVTCQLPHTRKQQHVLLHILKKEGGDTACAYSTDSWGESSLNVRGAFHGCGLPHTGIEYQEKAEQIGSDAVEVGRGDPVKTIRAIREL